MRQIPATLCLAIICCAAQAQQPDSIAVRKQTLDSLTAFFSPEDSLAILDLLDSLITLGPAKETSLLALRLGYNSNIIADNRTFNIEQFGLAPGVSYYHKSGMYADFSAYWSKEYDPNLYLSVASIGYLNTFGKVYSLLGEYSRYFYNLPSDSTVSVSYTNNIGISNYFDFKPIVFRLDYYLYFGNKTGHRIMPSLGVNLVKRKWLGIDRFAFYPSFNVMFGSEEITSYELYPNLLARFLYNRNNTPKLPYYYEKNTTKFGVMNYAFSAPISITKKDWTFLLSYTYNIPMPLPGEDLSLQNSGYLAFSVTRYFGL